MRNTSRPALLLTLIVLLTSIMLVTSPPSKPAHGAPPAQTTPTGITVEAVGEANVRSGPGLDYEVVGTIVRGTRYEALGRHEIVPWLLIEYPFAPSGVAWVYADLVTASVPTSNLPIVNTQTVQAIPTQAVTPTATLVVQSTVATPDSAADVYAEPMAEVNVRFGPGVDYPRIARIYPGTRYPVVSRHALFPWLLIELPEAPDGTGWIFADVVQITGNVNSLPVITATEVGWPTLTPTPPFVVTSAPPWNGSDPSEDTPIETSVDLPALGDQILSYLLTQGFAPEEDTFGSVFLLDLETGNSISLGRDIAYSGMSLIKIPILAAYYRFLNQPPDARQAEIIANTMICSGNHTANAMLAEIGGGDPYTGTERVNDLLTTLGLSNTFIVAPFKLGDEPVDDRPVSTLTTSADQTKSAPDPYNQVTPEDLGWLLGAIYQCAANETGPLMDRFSGEFTGDECRQMLLAMSRNKINVLTEAGVPDNTQVAHKHGWIDDTHGDAAVVFTPGGNYVLTMILHGREWLPYEQSWPVMAEIARMTYNAFNPSQPLEAIHPSTVDETCNLSDSPLLGELQQSIVPSFLLER